MKKCEICENPEAEYSHQFEQSLCDDCYFERGESLLTAQDEKDTKKCLNNWVNTGVYV